MFDVDWYIGIVFLQTVFDGSGYAACNGVASSCCGCGLGFFRELFAGGWGDAFGVEQAPEFLEGDHEVYITSYGMSHGFQFFGGAWSDEDYFCAGVFFFYNAGSCHHRGQLLGDVVDHSREVFLCHDGPGRAAGSEEEREVAGGYFFGVVVCLRDAADVCAQCYLVNV